MRGGGRRVFIVARADPYGTGLLDGVSEDLVKAGVKKADISSRTYQPDQKDFTDLARAAYAFHPDSVMVAGFDESAKVIAALQAAGIAFSRAP